MLWPWLLLAGLHYANGLGCMKPICAGNDKNDLRPCPGIDGTCGNYHTARANGEIVDGIDLSCSRGAVVKAPFDGELYFWRPFGGAQDKKCADQGVRIEGTGQWRGYAVHISSIKLKSFGGTVKAGDEIGTVMDRSCFNPRFQEVDSHVEVKLYREGRVIDPTYHLQNCMCTGQICESNSRNSFFGDPYRSDKRFNGVRGWDLECPLLEEVGDEPRVPLIYSPIDGETIGRTRLVFDSNNQYDGCDNDGIFVIGTDNWIGFEVRLYNVKTRSDLGFGRKHIIQGEPIGMRMNCNNSPDSVFMEFRYQGRVVNVSDLISATTCQLPVLPSP